jgi:hypothetical protein
MKSSDGQTHSQLKFHIVRVTHDSFTVGYIITKINTRRSVLILLLTFVIPAELCYCGEEKHNCAIIIWFKCAP